MPRSEFEEQAAEGEAARAACWASRQYGRIEEVHDGGKLVLRTFKDEARRVRTMAGEVEVEAVGAEFGRSVEAREEVAAMDPESGRNASEAERDGSAGGVGAKASGCWRVVPQEGAEACMGGGGAMAGQRMRLQ